MQTITNCEPTSAMPARTLTARAKRQPLHDVGQRFRLAREAQGLLQREVAERAHMRQAQLSRLENGFGVDSRFYVRVAETLGYRSMLDLLRVEFDPQTRKLLRLLDRIEDEDIRAAAIRKLRVWLTED